MNSNSKHQNEMGVVETVLRNLDDILTWENMKHEKGSLVQVLEDIVPRIQKNLANLSIKFIKQHEERK